MTSVQVITIISLIAFGLGIGLFTARSSRRREPIHSRSAIANFCHYLACAFLTAMTPAILASIFILHLGIVGALAVGIVLFAGGYLLLIPFAVAEQPAAEAAIAARQDRGWTREDAEQSGL